MHGDLGNMKLKSAIISVALVCSLVSLSSVCKAESFGFFFEDHGTSFSMRQSTDGHRAPPAPRGDTQHFNHPAPPSLIITQVTDHLTLMLHHHLHLDILDMVDQEDIMAGKQKKGRACTTFF